MLMTGFYVLLKGRAFSWAILPLMWLVLCASALGAQTPGGSGSILKLGAQVSQDFSFELPTQIRSSEITLNFFGSDFDADEDGDFTLADVYINGVQVVSFQEEGVDWGLGENGLVGEVSVDISEYLEPGENSLQFRNPEVEGETDYIEIYEIDLSGEVNAKPYYQKLKVPYFSLIGRNLTPDGLRFLQYQIDPANSVSIDIQIDTMEGDKIGVGELLINGALNLKAGSDPIIHFSIRHQVDGRWSDRIPFYSVKASESGLGQNGEATTLSLPLKAYLKPGFNKVDVELDSVNTSPDDALYIHWAYLKSLAKPMAEAKKIEGFAQRFIGLGEELIQNDTLACQTRISYNFYLGASELEKGIQLVLFGTDIDFDQDQDFTEVEIAVNEEVIFNEEIVSLGFGENGERGRGVLALGEYLVEGLNTVTIWETEVTGQKDLLVIDKALLVDGGTEQGVGGVRVSASKNDRQKRIERNKRALLIGNSSYKNLPDISSVKNDIYLLQTTLEEKGFAVSTCDNCDLEKLRIIILNYLRNLPADALNIIYYGGYSVQVKGNNYLIPTDAVLQQSFDVDFECINLQMIIDELKAKSNVESVFLLDAGYQHPILDQWGLGGKKVLSFQDQLNEKTFLAFGTIPGNFYPLPKTKNGLFAQTLAAELANTPLQVSDLFQRVRIEVLNLSEGQQIPWMVNKLSMPLTIQSEENGN